MTNILTIKKNTLALMQQSQAVAEKLGYKTSAKTIAQSVTQFQQKKLSVVTIGEAKRGKSSLLNAFLNQKELIFPVNANVATNIVTILGYGEKERIMVSFEDGNAKTKEIKRKELVDYVTEQGNPGNYKRVSMVHVYLPIPLLGDGVVFVDTPGVGSLNIAHAETTYQFLPDADVILFVSDADSGLTETELKFLNRGYGYCKNIIYPLTKKDVNSRYHVIEEDNRGKIAQATGLESDQVKIIPVSSTLKLDYLESGDEDDLEDSNFQQLETAVWDMVAKTKMESLILPFLLTTKQELITMSRSLASQHQLLQADKDEVKALIEAFNKEQARLKELQKNNATWNKKIQQFCTEVRQENVPIVTKATNAARVQVDTAVQRMGTKLCEESNYQQLIQNVNAIFTECMLEIRADLTEKMNKKVLEISSELGLDMTYTGLIDINFTPDPELHVTFPEYTMGQKVSSAGRAMGTESISMMRVGMMAGGALGFAALGAACLILGPAALGATAVVESIVGGVAIGASAGTTGGVLVGSTKGLVKSLREHPPEDLNLLRTEINSHIVSVTADLNLVIQKSQTSMQQALLDGFADKITQRISEVQENMARTQQNINTQKNDIPAKQATLQKKNEALVTLLNRCEAVQAEVGKASKPQKPADTAKPQAKPTKTEQEVTYDFL